MTAASNAYAALVSIASQGRPYRYDEVYTNYGKKELEPECIIGNGFDFTAQVPMLGDSAGLLVQGRAELRILRLHNKNTPRLLLRTRLSWLTAVSERHTSFAAYEITPEAVSRLQETGNSAGFADSCDTSWIQTYPDSDPKKAYELPEQAVVDYHSLAARTAQKTAPALLCMLTDTNTGSMEPQELVLLLEYIQARL